MDNHTMIGIQAGIDLYKSDFMTSFSISTRYSAGINIRRFFPLNDGKYGFFLQGQAIYDYNTSTFKFSNITYHGRDIKDYRLSIAPGAFLFVSESNAFEFMFANLFYLKDLESSRSVVGFNSTTTSFLVGFHHYFNFPRTKVAIPKNLNR